MRKMKSVSRIYLIIKMDRNLTREFYNIYIDNPSDARLKEIVKELGTENIFHRNYTPRLIHRRGTVTTDVSIIDILFTWRIRQYFPKNILEGTGKYYDKRFLCILLVEHKLLISRLFSIRSYSTDPDFDRLEKELIKYAHLFSELDGWDSIDINWELTRTVIKRRICPVTNYPTSKHSNIFVRIIVNFIRNKQIYLQWLNEEILTDLLYYISRWDRVGSEYIYNSKILFDRNRLEQFLANKHPITDEIGTITIIEYLAMSKSQKFWDVIIILLKLGGKLEVNGNVSKFGIKINFRALFYLGVFRDYYPLCVKRELYILSRAISKFKNWKNVKCYNNIILSIPFHPKYGNERKDAEENYYSLLQSLNNNS